MSRLIGKIVLCFIVVLFTACKENRIPERKDFIAKSYLINKRSERHLKLKTGVSTPLNNLHFAQKYVSFLDIKKVLGDGFNTAQSVDDYVDGAVYPTQANYNSIDLSFYYLVYEGNVSRGRKEYEILEFKFGMKSGLILNDSIIPGKTTKKDIEKHLGNRYSTNGNFGIDHVDMNYEKLGLGFNLKNNSDTVEFVIYQHY